MHEWHNVEHNSQAWWDLRIGNVTSSDFDRILTAVTLKPSRQSEDFENEKIGEWITNESANLYQSPYMEHGVEYQDTGVSAYEAYTDNVTSPGGFFTIYGGMIGASPDRRVDPNGLLEIKCPQIKRQVAAARAEDLAQHYGPQLQGQLWVAEREWVDIFSYHPAFFIPPARVYRNEKVITALSIAVPAFVEHMLAERARLEAKYGPFIRLAKQAAVPASDPMAVTDADLDAIFAARRRELEKHNG